ncbi:flavin reductase family protein [Martelella mediterranea]|uniref:FMN reductase (NADH) NtaB n=1 Tax=Martelella mediterranea DSM 17316 TaxID=1122214 RepID=A0A1U9Z639_9HYPH|nr:flavin reductase family protein [Martelella mediterranea]AQZ53042.1 FMN reductase (NADH) NtaB [Martelella mediterranea DSM 17316]
MRIILSTGALPRLEDPGDFKRFAVALETRLTADLKAAVAPVADLDVDGAHIWVRPDAIRALSPLAGQAEWEAGFSEMMRFAAKHGWIDDQGRIRAHIETFEGQPAVDADVFRRAMRRFASGVCLVAAGEDEERRGLTVSAFSSVSADPPMVLVCINRSTSAHRKLTGSSYFSVNILGAGQQEIAMLFAGQRGLQGAARFDETWNSHRLGAPVLASALYSIVCASEANHVAGSHTIMIGRVVDATTNRHDGGPALINYDGAMGHSIRAA